MAKYAVDEVHYQEDMARVLSDLKPVTLHLLCGTNTDRCHKLFACSYFVGTSILKPATLLSCSSIATQPADFDGMKSFKLDKSDVLFNVLTECRVVRLAWLAQCHAVACFVR